MIIFFTASESYGFGKKGITMKNSIKSKLILTAVIALCTASAMSCSNEASSVTDNTSSTVTEAVTEAETTEAQETEAETEAETTVPETTVPETEAVTEAETTEAQSTEVPSNKEMLRYLSTKFGFISDGSFEKDVEAAKTWDVFEKDAVIDPDEKITAESLISAAMRAASFVDLDASLDEILSCAYDNKVISAADIASVDVSDWKGVLDRASYSWTHQTFDNEISVELCDGVVDLSNTISYDDYVIDGSTIELPSSVAAELKDASVVILPKNPETKKGGAYKIIKKEESGDKLIIEGLAAGIEDVYKSISSN